MCLFTGEKEKKLFIFQRKQKSIFLESLCSKERPHSYAGDCIVQIILYDWSVTREAPENIGSALKSIVSRYGELKSDPTTLVDAEGEELSLNKVDTALKSVGITLQDTNGQFRAFDDVIMELSERWDTLSKNQQRYELENVS